LPATVLFQDFHRVCRTFTRHYYESVLQEDFDKKTLRPVLEMIGRREAEAAAGKALDRYFQVHVPILRPLRVEKESVRPPGDPQAALGDLRRARAEMLEHLEEYKKLIERFEVAENSWLLACEAQALSACHLKVQPEEFQLQTARTSAIKDKINRSWSGIEHLGARMLPFESAAEERLSLALRLLQVPAVARRIKDGEELRLEMLRTIPHARFISRLMASIPPLRSAYRKLSVLCQRLGKHPRQELIESIEAQLKDMHATLRKLHAEMGQRHYPFEHADAEMTLAKFALPIVPEPMDLYGMVAVSGEMFERLAGLQVRLFAKLAQSAEQVEQALGMPRLPDPRTTEQS
jgi:hypothetical protein